MLYVINILYYLIADLDLLLVISCYSKLCYGVKIVLSQDEYLLPTTSKSLIYLCFLRSYNYTRTQKWPEIFGFPASFYINCTKRRLWCFFHATDVQPLEKGQRQEVAGSSFHANSSCICLTFFFGSDGIRNNVKPLDKTRFICKNILRFYDRRVKPLDYQI